MAYHPFAESPRTPRHPFPPPLPRVVVSSAFSYTRYFQLIQLTPSPSLFLFQPPAPPPVPSNSSWFLFSHSLRVALRRFISPSFFLNFFSLPFTISLSALLPYFQPTLLPPFLPRPCAPSSLPCSHSFARPLFFLRVLSHDFLYMHRTISCTYQTGAYLPHLFQATISVVHVDVARETRK